MRDEEGGMPEITGALAAGMALAGSQPADGEYVVVPEGYELESLEGFRTVPWRKRGTVVLEWPASFAAYVERHKDAAHTTLWAGVDRRSLTAVLNDHSGDIPAWRDHRAHLQLEYTPEFRDWRKGHNEWWQQRKFAEFLEDHLPDVVKPDGAELLEVCTHLQAHTKVAFESGQRLQDGTVQFTYREETEAKSGSKGQLRVPERFRVGLAIFRGQELRVLQGRLRWRIDPETKQLRFQYVLDRLEQVERDAFDEVVAEVESKLGLTALRGDPGAELD